MHLTLPSRHRRSSEPGRVTAHELAEVGLDNWPDATAVFFLQTQRTVCRSHVEAEDTRRLLEVLADPDDVGRVLTTSTTSQNRARRLCALCPDTKPPAMTEPGNDQDVARYG